MESDEVALEHDIAVYSHIQRRWLNPTETRCHSLADTLAIVWVYESRMHDYKTWALTLIIQLGIVEVFPLNYRHLAPDI